MWVLSGLVKLFLHLCLFFCSHTASTAAGNYGVPVVMNGFHYGNASGIAPRARSAVALFLLPVNFMASCHLKMYYIVNFLDNRNILQKFLTLGRSF